MKIKFIAGPPGTGKTHDFIKGKYLELYKKYGYENIVVLSHTNVAADQIRKAIANLKIVKENSVTEKKLEDKICTIHHYCRSH
jgi:superfamily II DNA or RNA helicase